MPEALTQIGLNLPLPLLDQCVHCGFCLPACPTYVLWGNEMDSPRGRIWMMRQAALGTEPPDATLRTHIDNCLGCMACMTACPSGVHYDELLESTRAQLEQPTGNWQTGKLAPESSLPPRALPPRTLSDRLFRALLFATFPHPRRLRWLAVPLALYQRLGLQGLLRRSGLLRLLPRRLRAMESLTPRVPLNPFHALPTNLITTTPTRGRVALLTGCVQDAFFSHVNAATARVLAAVGYQVVIPRGQSCCGALAVHTGLEADARASARRLIERFEQAACEGESHGQFDAIVVNAAGCGSSLKQYGHLLRDDPAFAARAAAFSARCKDVAELLAETPLPAALAPLPLRVAYHDACHLRHAQGIVAQPRALLAQVPGLTVAELAEPTLCCGSAGVYNLLHPEPADELADRKVAHLLALRAEGRPLDALISANPGCLLQLQAALRRAGHAELPTFHMVELLDASLRGLTPAQLLTPP